MINGNNNEGAKMINRKNGPKGIDWDSQPLGREPDYRIAKRLGVAPGSVSSGVGRTHVHCGRDAYSIATGERRANRYGFGIQAWEPAAHEASKRMEAKADLLMKRTNAWYEVAKLTESQLDRILAILEEVQT